MSAGKLRENGILHASATAGAFTELQAEHAALLRDVQASGRLLEVQHARNEWNTRALLELREAHESLRREHEASTRALEQLRQQSAETTRALADLRVAHEALLRDRNLEARSAPDVETVAERRAPHDALRRLAR